MMDPDVVLADEPVASLDPTVSRHVLQLLKRASRQRKTTVLCSLHQVEFALEFADRIVALKNGKVVHDGPPARLSTGDLREIYGADIEAMSATPVTAPTQAEPRPVGVPARAPAPLTKE